MEFGDVGRGPAGRVPVAVVQLRVELAVVQDAAAVPGLARYVLDGVGHVGDVGRLGRRVPPGRGGALGAAAVHLVAGHPRGRASAPARVPEDRHQLDPGRGRVGQLLVELGERERARRGLDGVPRQVDLGGGQAVRLERGEARLGPGGAVVVEVELGGPQRVAVDAVADIAIGCTVVVFASAREPAVETAIRLPATVSAAAIQGMARVRRRRATRVRLRIVVRFFRNETDRGSVESSTGAPVRSRSWLGLGLC